MMCLIAKGYQLLNMFNIRLQEEEKNYPWMQDCGFVLIQKQG